MHLKKAGARFDFYDWKIGIDVSKRPDDPLRSWTVKLENGERIIINGLQLVHKTALLEIRPTK